MNVGSHHAAAPNAVRPASGRRLYWIDTVRIALTVLVIAHHCAVTYGNIPVWFYHEPSRDPSGWALDVFVIINQSYFMGLFFLISGYFAPAAIDRKNPRVFARDRLIRLGIPLLAFTLFIRPLAGFWSWKTSDNKLPYALHYLVTMDPGPTWFLEVLLVFSLTYAGYRALRPHSQLRPAPEGPLRWGVAAGAVGGLIAITAVLMAFWRQFVPDGTYWPIVGLPTPAFLPQYALMFATGVLAARRHWLERMPGALAAPGGILSVFAVILLLPSAMSSDPVEAAIAGGVAMAVLGVGLSLVVLTAFRRFAPGTGPIRQFLSANAFTVYVIHPVVLVALALLLRGLAAPAFIKFAALLVLSVPMCWLLACLLRRIPSVRKIM